MAAVGSLGQRIMCSEGRRREALPYRQLPFGQSQDPCRAILRWDLQPADRAEEIPLSDRHAAMTQDVVCRRYKEEEIRLGKLLQIVVALHFPRVATAGPGNDLLLRAIDLCASKGLHEAQGGFDAALGRGETGVVHGGQRGRSNASEAATRVHGEIR